MASVQTLHDGISTLEDKSGRHRTWSVDDWLREARGSEEPAIAEQRNDPILKLRGDIPPGFPVHNDWLFSACEPRITDLVHRIDMHMSQRPRRLLQFIGAGRGVGTSTVAFAYASAAAALRQRRVLLLSADERDAAPGLLACMSGKRPASESVRKLHGNLSYGTLVCESDDDLDVQTMMADADLWRAISTEFDEVVVDCRSLDASTGALSMAPRADGIVVVIQAGHTSDSSARELLRTLEAVAAPVLGAVLNQRVATRLFGARGDDE